MAEDRQPPAVVEGATTGDVEDEVAPASAEDRKAAAALAKLDAAPRDDEAGAGGRDDVDHEAVSKAMKNLGEKKGGGEAAAAAKKVKVDAADVALLVDQLELSKPKATELLRQHDGDAVKAMTAFIAVN